MCPVASCIFAFGPYSSELFHWIPTQFLKMDHCVIFNHYAFIFKQFLHGRRWVKMDFAGQQAISVDYPVGRDEWLLAVAAVERPAHYPGRHPGSQVPCDSAIAGYPAGRNHPGSLVHPFVKIIHFTILFRWFLPKLR